VCERSRVLLNRGIRKEWIGRKPPLLRIEADARRVVKIAKHNIQRALTQFVNPAQFSRSLFLDVVKELTANGFTTEQIPAKLEGLALGPDVDNNGTPTHTLWLANENDFLQDLNGAGTNPNQFFVFGFTDTDLAGLVYVPQQAQGSAKKD
jgi:hypothetical protein